MESIKWIFFFLVVILLSCKKQQIDIPSPDKMVLIFMAANNDLKSDAIDCINKIEAGYDGNKKLLVFVKTEDQNSYILKVKKDNTNKIVSDTLITYGNNNTSNPQFVNTIISDSRKILPATEYGLILWSHASSWAPPINSFSTKSFGYDNGIEMDIIDLKYTLPNDFVFIIFDACSMASIETLYELKDNAEYLLASPTSVLSSSYPYQTILPLLFGSTEDLKAIAKNFVDYYKQFNGLYSSATASLIKTKELKSFAYIVKLFNNTNPVVNYKLENIQRLDFESKDRVKAYDFSSYLKNNYEPSTYRRILDQLNKVVIYKDNTSSFLGNPITTFSGISVYLPTPNDPLLYYYSRLEWYKDSGWEKLFSKTN